MKIHNNNNYSNTAQLPRQKKDKQDYSNITQITNSHIDYLNFKTTKNLRAVSQGDYNSMKKTKLKIGLN